MINIEIQLFSFRSFAILFTALTFIIFGEKIGLTIYFPYIISHYFIAFYYGAKSEINKTSNYKNLSLWLLLISIFSLFLNTYIPLNVTLYFVIHSILTDLYLYKFYKNTQNNVVFYLRVIFNIFAYLFLIHNHQLLEPLLNRNYLAILSIGFFLLTLSYCKVFKKSFPLIEIPLFLLICFLYFNELNISFHHIVFYHVSMWLIIPISRGFKSFAWPLFLQLIFFSILFKFEIWNYINFSNVHKNDWISYLAYFHITSSFFSSQLNPKFMIEAKNHLFYKTSLTKK